MAESKEVVVPELDDAALRGIESFDDALALMRDMGVDVSFADQELGTGFDLAKKETLVGVPFFILSSRETPGDFGEPYVLVRAVTRETPARKVVIADGSSGMAKQIRLWWANTGRNGGLYCAKGLRFSTYATCPGKNCNRPRPPEDEVCKVCGDKGKTRGTGTTYYIDESAAQAA